MVRAVLIVMTALPLLLPAGVCVCHAHCPARDVTDTAAVDDDVCGSELFHFCSERCGGRHDASEHGGGHQKHAPNCFVVKAHGFALLRSVHPTAHFAPVVLPWLAATGQCSRGGAPLAVADDHDASSSPRYLTLRTLLI